MNWCKILSAQIIILFTSQTVFSAASERTTSSIDHQTLSIRALGMGGAISAAADDFNALAFNPAGLANIKEYQIRGTIGAGVDGDFLDLGGDISDAGDAANDVEETQAIITAIERQFGNNPYARITPLYGAWVWKGWGISFTPADATIELGVDQQIGPSIDVSTTIDSTLMIGRGKSIKSRKARMSWGVTGKLIHRAFYQDTLTAAQLAEDDDYFQSEDADEGLTFDIDAGFLFSPRPPSRGFFKFLKYIRPTFSLVGRNLIDYGFTTNFNLIDDNSGEPPKLGRRFDFGSKFELRKWWLFKPRFVFDIRDMGQENWTFKKGYHAGFELDWVVGSLLKGAYRVGLNQGYLTLGVTMKLLWFELGAAYYGEEVGTDESSNESRRYMVNLSMDI